MQNAKKTVMTVSRKEYERLYRLAESMETRLPDVAELFLAELDRSVIVDEGSLPFDVVQMGSEIRCTVDGEDKELTLVFPGEADIAKGKISIMTPMGIALLGATAGNLVEWQSRDLRFWNSAQVHDVMHPDMQPALAMAS